MTLCLFYVSVLSKLNAPNLNFQGWNKFYTTLINSAYEGIEKQIKLVKKINFDFII